MRTVRILTLTLTLTLTLIGGLTIDENGQDPYGTFGKSMMSMCHITIGDWVDIMTPAVEASNNASTWFFTSYIFIVSVLFANLFIGIIIKMHKTSQMQLQSFAGKCEMNFSQVFEGQTEKHTYGMIYMIGKIAVNTAQINPIDTKGFTEVAFSASLDSFIQEIGLRGSMDPNRGEGHEQSSEDKRTLEDAKEEMMRNLSLNKVKKGETKEMSIEDKAAEMVQSLTLTLTLTLIGG